MMFCNLLSASTHPSPDYDTSGRGGQGNTQPQNGMSLPRSCIFCLSILFQRPYSLIGLMLFDVIVKPGIRMSIVTMSLCVHTPKYSSSFILLGLTYRTNFVSSRVRVESLDNKFPYVSLRFGSTQDYKGELEWRDIIFPPLWIFPASEFSRELLLEYWTLH